MTSHVDRIVHVAFLAIWFFSAWHASDGWSERRYSPADRLKNFAVFVVTELFVLAAAHALYPVVIVGVGVACAVARTLSRRRAHSVRPSEASRADNSPWILPIVMVIVIGWPGLVRPLLDGDSLSYHLPNAASWVHAHSLWTTSTYYWWYPPASELFAAGVFAVGGAATLGIAGLVPVALLALRFAEFTREVGFRPLESSAISCAIVTVPTIALQAGSLQNDVWLAALLLEGYWVASHGRRDIALWAVTALTKPVGAIFSIALLLLVRRSRLEFVAIVVAAGAWLLHDAILSAGAIIPPSHQAYSDLMRTSIAAQGFEGIRTLGEAIWHQGLGFIALSCGCLLSPFVGKGALRSASLVFLALYVFEPFGFATFADQQLATGASLRFALPAVIFGAVAALPFLRTKAKATAIAAGLLVVWQTYGIVEIFWNDAVTRSSSIVGLIVAVLTYAGGSRRRLVFPFVLTAAASYAVWLDDSPTRYYDARIAGTGKKSTLFEWIARTKPTSIVVRNFGAGMFSVVSPSSEVENASLRDDCLQAVRASAILIVPTRLANPHCGDVIYEDERAIVLRP